ncbi:MAG: hypothetical protein N2246_00025 [Candidatus Sumerlaeia bacterium]|nr:hypothetical protein [Candidatus Sumerlaeia bacterium]
MSERRGKMKECFGLQMGFGPEGTAPHPQDIEKCYHCEDFDACFKYCLIRTLNSLRFEIRFSAQNIRQAIGGSHSEIPLW